MAVKRGMFAKGRVRASPKPTAKPRPQYSPRSRPAPRARVAQPMRAARTAAPRRVVKRPVTIMRTAPGARRAIRRPVAVPTRPRRPASPMRQPRPTSSKPTEAKAAAEKTEAKAEERGATAEQKKAGAEKSEAKSAERKAKAEFGLFKKLKSFTKSDPESATSAAPSFGKGASLVLLIVGSFHYFLRYNYGQSSFAIILSIFLFFTAGFAIAAKVQKKRMAVFIPMLVFFVWYFILGAPGDLYTNIYFAIAVGFVISIPLALSKGGSAAAEMVGIIPIFLFFADVGFAFFANWLNVTYGIVVTPLLQGLFLWMPWWALLGFWTLPSDPASTKSGNIFLLLIRIISIAYILAILMAMAVPDIGFSDAESLIPDFEQFKQAEDTLRGQLPKGEHPFISNMGCIFSGAYTELSKCVKKRQDDALIIAICEEREDVKKKQRSMQDCIKDETEKKKMALKVTGSVDQNVLPLKVSFDVPKLTIQYIASPSFPATLIVENPRELVGLNAVINCSFVKGKESFKATVNGEETLTKELDGDYKEVAISCSPVEDFAAGDKTAYTMRISAVIENIETLSTLKRAFIGEVDILQKKKIVDELMQDQFSNKNKINSKAPEDPARLNFYFGTSDNNPIIGAADTIVFVATVENNLRGKVFKIREYQTNLAEKGFSVKKGGSECLQRGEWQPPRSAPKTFSLPSSSCLLELPSHYKEARGVETFFATLKYDYLISTEHKVYVQVIAE